MFRCHRWFITAAILLLTAPGCSSRTLPSSAGAFNAAANPSLNMQYARPADTTPILSRLTKDVEIGSTVDAKNGDKGPRSLSITPCDCAGGRLAQGQLVVCNFENKAGALGEGTTIEALNPQPKSKPQRFGQANSLKGCDGTAITSINNVYGAGLTTGRVVHFTKKGSDFGSLKTAAAPFSDVDVQPRQFFSPEYVFVGTTAGGIVNLSVGFHGNGRAVQVVEGFATSKGSQGSLAPSGLQYDRSLDTLYVVDGANNTISAISHASELTGKNVIIVQPGGKTFRCKYPEVTCATLVAAGKPFEAPIAATLLPNGNLIVANTEGRANKLIELTPTGQVLDTKIVDASKTQGVFGLAAAGTNDDNTVVFYTDTNTNTVQELEP